MEHDNASFGQWKWIKWLLEHLGLCLSHSKYLINVSYHLNGQFLANPRAQPPALHRKGKFPCQTLGRTAERHSAAQGASRGQVRGGSGGSTSRRYSQDMLLTFWGQDRVEGPRHWTKKLIGSDAVSQNPLSKKDLETTFLSFPFPTRHCGWSENILLRPSFSLIQPRVWPAHVWTAETLSRVTEKVEKNVNGMKERALIGDVGVLTSMWALSFNNHSSQRFKKPFSLVNMWHFIGERRRKIMIFFPFPISFLLYSSCLHSIPLSLAV